MRLNALTQPNIKVQRPKVAPRRNGRTLDDRFNRQMIANCPYKNAVSHNIDVSIIPCSRIEFEIVVRCSVIGGRRAPPPLHSHRNLGIYNTFEWNSPLAANEMNACACFLILLMSVCWLLIGKRTNKCSKKSNGVTDDIFHFNLLSTINSHCCNSDMKRKRKTNDLVIKIKKKNKIQNAKIIQDSPWRRCASAKVRSERFLCHTINQRRADCDAKQHLIEWNAFRWAASHSALPAVYGIDHFFIFAFFFLSLIFGDRFASGRPFVPLPATRSIFAVNSFR